MTDTTRFSAETSLEDATALAGQLRVDSIRMSTGAGSGHPTSSLSAADLHGGAARREAGISAIDIADAARRLLRAPAS